MDELKTKKIPMRMCVACREMKSKKELIRVVRDEDGTIHIDPSSKAPGRGAYICNDVACLEKAVKIRAFERALGGSIQPEAMERLKEDMAAHAETEK